jgi:hypothetical protein
MYFTFYGSAPASDWYGHEKRIDKDFRRLRVLGDSRRSGSKHDARDTNLLNQQTFNLRNKELKDIITRAVGIMLPSQ